MTPGWHGHSNATSCSNPFFNCSKFSLTFWNNIFLSVEAPLSFFRRSLLCPVITHRSHQNSGNSVTETLCTSTYFLLQQWERSDIPASCRVRWDGLIDGLVDEAMFTTVAVFALKTDECRLGTVDWSAAIIGDGGRDRIMAAGYFGGIFWCFRSVFVRRLLCGWTTYGFLIFCFLGCRGYQPAYLWPKKV